MRQLQLPSMTSWKPLEWNKQIIHGKKWEHLCESNEMVAGSMAASTIKEINVKRKGRPGIVELAARKTSPLRQL